MSRATVSASFFLVFGVLLPGVAQAQVTDDPLAKARAALQRTLHETKIDTTVFQERMPFAQFLQGLEKQLPKESKLTLAVSEKDFGAAGPKVSAAPIRPSAMPAKQSLNVLLQRALAQVRKELNLDVEYALAPDRVVITTPRLAVYAVHHDLRDVAAEIDALSDLVRFSGTAKVVELRGTDAPALLRRLHAALEPRSWERLQLNNGTTLIVHAAPARQEEIAAFLQAWRRLADLAVVMNARVYGVERSWFAKEVAPLLASGKEPGDQVLVPLSFDGPIVKKLQAATALVRGDDLKIRPGRPTTFLSVHELVPVGEATNPQQGPAFRTPLAKTGVSGVAFSVRAEVSADRRYLRLAIIQKVNQPGKIRQVRFGDPQTGFEKLDHPTGTKTQLSATVTLPDGAALLMPVSYVPPTGDRVWVLLAEPRIYIEEEERQIREAQGKR